MEKNPIKGVMYGCGCIAQGIDLPVACFLHKELVTNCTCNNHAKGMCPQCDFIASIIKEKREGKE